MCTPILHMRWVFPVRACRAKACRYLCAGFLTPYDVDDFENALERVLGANEAPVFCTLRTRKCCEVFL